MLTNTQALFAAVVKAEKADCICDIGSRDGAQSLFFRRLCPCAVVLAFEANPINFRKMAANPQLTAQGVRVLPYAVAAAHGTAPFHVIDVNYEDPRENTGISSLLVHEGLKVKQTVMVEMRRVDDVVMEEHPTAKSVGLWIDVEGAEFGVLQGMERIQDRVVALHVETARRPLRLGQRTYDEVARLLAGWGFRPAGTNMRASSDWGDVVFVSDLVRARLGWRWGLCRLKGYAGHWFRAGEIAVFLKTRCPWLYRALRNLYIRFGT